MADVVRVAEAAGDWSARILCWAVAAGICFAAYRGDLHLAVLLTLVLLGLGIWARLSQILTLMQRAERAVGIAKAGGT